MHPPIDFGALFELSPNPYMVLDRALRFVAANRAYLAVTASRREDLLGRHILDAFPHDPDDPHNAPARMLRASLERVLATGEPDVLALIPYRVPRHTAAGVVEEERFWSATHTPLRGPDGSVAFVLQHTVDVTEVQRLRASFAALEPGATRTPVPLGVEAGILGRAHAVQQANRVLDSERRQLLSLFAQAPGFVGYLAGPEHVFELVNSAYSQLMGHRDVLGKRVRDALPELAGQGFYELLDRVYTSGEPYVGHGMPAQLQRRPGAPLEVRYVDFVYQPIRDADGCVAGILVQGQDITEQRLAQLAAEAARREAEEASRLKDDFLATVSHELRTPLSSILGWAQLLRSRALTEEKRARALDTIERNARAQSALIEDLLDVSRVLAGTLRLDVGRVALEGAVEAALETVRPAAEARGVTLHATLAPGACVTGDAQRLQQVAWNLLSNAVKFTPRGGRVDVHVEVQGDTAELTVRDTGQGITPAFLPHVFERFRQEDGSSRRSHGGLGLGLSIVRHLVELHGGSVHVASEGEGRGATFRVCLPRAAAREVADVGGAALAHAAQTEGAPAAPQLTDLHVLVVEDAADMRDLLRAVLEGCSARVTTAGSAAEGLRALRAARPHLLVSDVGLPGEDGYAFIRQVRGLSESEGGRTPAVALTAYARAEDRTRALLAGFQNHVPKPVEPLELVTVLARLSEALGAPGHAR